MTRLVLWDVDGTLVHSGDVGRDVFGRAMEAVVGKVPLDRVRMSGKTDPQIVLESLALLELESPDRHLGEIMARLEQELAAAAHLVAEQGRVMPGVTAVLDRLASDKAVVQSVLTGNIAANALVKLSAFGLDRFVDLEVGAFGDDHLDRKALVPVALERVARRRGRQVAPEAVWVVGDTPRDLECARAGGARCLLVATGGFSLGELEALRPDAVLADLSDHERVVELLAG